MFQLSMFLGIPVKRQSCNQFHLYVSAVISVSLSQDCLVLWFCVFCMYNSVVHCASLETWHWLSRAVLSCEITQPCSAVCVPNELCLSPSPKSTEATAASAKITQAASTCVLTPQLLLSIGGSAWRWNKWARYAVWSANQGALFSCKLARAYLLPNITHKLLQANCSLLVSMDWQSSIDSVCDVDIYVCVCVRCVWCVWGVCEVCVRCVRFVWCAWGVCEVCVRCVRGVCEVCVRCVWGVCDVNVWGIGVYINDVIAREVSLEKKVQCMCEVYVCTCVHMWCGISGRDLLFWCRINGHIHSHKKSPKYIIVSMKSFMFIALSDIRDIRVKWSCPDGLSVGALVVLICKIPSVRAQGYLETWCCWSFSVVCTLSTDQICVNQSPWAHISSAGE